MSAQYTSIGWNRNKRQYDLAIALGVVLYLAVFVAVGRLCWSGGSEVLLLRALGTCGLLMLHLVLCIGPLARLEPRLLPVLYNRRHLGVATFLVGLAHAALATGYYHGSGRTSPLLSLLGSNTSLASWTAFPFELLGIGGLAVLYLLAATSHDFWQKNLGASAWKSLHMAVYAAYGLLVMHVVLGALQSEQSWFYAAALAAGVVLVAGLHLLAGLRERRREEQPAEMPANGGGEWLHVADVADLTDGRGHVVCLAGRERVALFRCGGQVSAVTNVCAHQRGPLGEGRIVDGCIRCPWHGWEYRAADGCSPPPFTEKIATYRVRVRGGRVLIDPTPLAPGTAVEPAEIEELVHA